MDISTSPVHCQMYACEFFVVFLSVSIFLGIQIFAKNTIQLCALCASGLNFIQENLKKLFKNFDIKMESIFFFRIYRSLLFCEWISTFTTMI